MFEPTSPVALDDAAAPPTTTADIPPAPAWRELPLRFTGSGREYFRVWIVHALLILLTLGLYIPFAKARRLRYFYAHTRIDGDSLVFHATGKRMFRGFLVLIALFGAYGLGRRFTPLTGYIGFLVLCVVWPELWRSGLKFRLGNTSWRGLRFSFRGDIADAYSAFGPVLWPLVLLSGAGFFFAAAIEGTVQMPGAWVRAITSSVAVIGLIGGVLYAALLPLALARIKRYQHNHYELADQRSRMLLGTGRFYGLTFKALGLGLLINALAGSLFGLAFWLVKDSGAPNQPLWVAAGTLTLIVSATLSWLIGSGFFSARLQDLIWSATEAPTVRFRSHLRARRLIGLTVKNWLLTLLTLGLYRPFAVTALWRLRLLALQIETCDDFSQWRGADSAAYLDARGEAAGDFFGIDVGL